MQSIRLIKQTNGWTRESQCARLAAAGARVDWRARLSLFVGAEEQAEEEEEEGASWPANDRQQMRLKLRAAIDSRRCVSSFSRVEPLQREPLIQLGQIEYSRPPIRAELELRRHADPPAARSPPIRWRDSRTAQLDPASADPRRRRRAKSWPLNSSSPRSPILPNLPSLVLAPVSLASGSHLELARVDHERGRMGRRIGPIIRAIESLALCVGARLFALVCVYHELARVQNWIIVSRRCVARPLIQLATCRGRRSSRALSQDQLHGRGTGARVVAGAPLALVHLHPNEWGRDKRTSATQQKPAR